jgi:hypothetical protein
LPLELCIGSLFPIGGRYHDTDYIEVFFKLTQESRQNRLDVDIIQLFFGDSELPSGLNEINSTVDLLRQYCSEFARRVDWDLRCHTFFSTECGRFGFGNPSVREGDIICYLYGILQPLILRNIDEH